MVVDYSTPYPISTATSTPARLQCPNRFNALLSYPRRALLSWLFALLMQIF